jgi:hypothetical protein
VGWSPKETLPSWAALFVGLVLLSPSDPTSALDTKSLSAPKGCLLLPPIRADLCLDARAFGHSELHRLRAPSSIDTEPKNVSANQHQPFPHKKPNHLSLYFEYTKICFYLSLRCLLSISRSYWSFLSKIISCHATRRFVSRSTLTLIYKGDIVVVGTIYRSNFAPAKYSYLCREKSSCRYNTMDVCKSRLQWGVTSKIARLRHHSRQGIVA